MCMCEKQGSLICGPETTVLKLQPADRPFWPLVWVCVWKIMGAGVLTRVKKAPVGFGLTASKILKR